jgi:PAS domain S-box-containing protein
MMPAPLPANEPARLEALRRLDILDTLPEPEFDRIAWLAATLVGAPIALISLVDADRQWFKARHGAIDATQMPREHAFCAHAILTEEGLMVEDAREDPRFADNPLVTGAPHIRCYAGAPITTSDGLRLGVLCVLDTVPCALTPTQQRGLRELAALVAVQLELRRVARENALYRAAIDALPDQVYAKDLHGRFIAANPATASFLGVGSTQDLLGRSDADFHPPALAESYRRDEVTALARGEATLFEQVTRAPDGSPGWLCALKVPLRDGQGRTVGLVGHNRDVTEQKRLQQELAATRDRLAYALDVSNDGLWDWDLRSGLARHNRRCEELLGYVSGSPSLNMDSWASRLHPEDRDRVLRATAELTAGRVAQLELEYRLPGRDDGWIWVRDRARVVESEPDGRPRRIVGVMSDITACKRLQAELAGAHRELRDVFDSIDELFFALDHELRFTIVNRACLAAWHLTPEQTIGRPILEVLPQLVGTDLVQLAERVLASGRAERIETYAPVQHVPIEVHVAPRRAGGLVAHLHDISARKAAEKAKATFLATMSHEIRTPLTAILGFADLLARSPLAPEQQEQLRIVRDTGQTLLTVVNDILDLSKLEAGKMSLERIPLELPALLREALGATRLLGAEKGLAFRAELAPDLPAWVQGDPVRLKQVVGNLLANALKFTPKGEVVLRARALAGGAAGVRVEVADTGIGIAAEQVPRLFGLFEQADQSTTRRFGGTGLGLAICRRLVEAMGGTIGVSSAPGVGSTFWFELPLAPAEAAGPPAAAPAAPVRAAPGRALRVLAVDDVATNRLLLTAFLRRLGHAPVMAEDGMQAVEVAGRERFDLILMDLHMPGLDGFMAARAIRAGGGPNAATPIVALSADVLTETTRACQEAGMAGSLAKPIETGRLQEVLELAAS